MKRNTVFFSGQSAEDYNLMFKNQGWERVGDMANADLVQFTGGSDVNPALYNQDEHWTTGFSYDRDNQDYSVYRLAQSLHLPMAGICRGGQFLNIMCGGDMWQDVNGHAIHGVHKMYNHWDGTEIDVTSTHHQMMIPHEDAVILGTACEATRKERFSDKGIEVVRMNKASVVSPQEEQDIEVLWYPEQKVLCFQPHPEFYGEENLAECYFGFVKLLMNPEAIEQLEEDAA